jgi:hypothetical protein
MLLDRIPQEPCPFWGMHTDAEDLYCQVHHCGKVLFEPSDPVLKAAPRRPTP